MSEIEEILKERGKIYNKYGTYADYSKCYTSLINTIQNTPGWEAMPAYQQATLYNILNKISRAIIGDKEYRDNWADIEGFSKLALDELEKETN